jgi:hypothetical protein
MGHTITVRLPKDLAQWLEETAAKSGVSQGRIIRDHLERSRSGGPARGFMKLAGAVAGPRGLSKRKGFSKP